MRHCLLVQLQERVVVHKQGAITTMLLRHGEDQVQHVLQGYRACILCRAACLCLVDEAQRLVHAIAGKEGFLLTDCQTVCEGGSQVCFDVDGGVLEQFVGHADDGCQLVAIQVDTVEGILHQRDGMALRYPGSLAVTVDDGQRAQLQQLHEETLSDPTARDADTYMDLYKAIEGLRPEYREVIKLFYLDDLSVKEIAQILNKNENTIKTQLFRARDTLKSVLEA